MPTTGMQRLNQTRWALPIFVVASIVWLLRQPELSGLTTIYIDDAIFLNQATVGNASLFTPHAGYLHVLPRFVASLMAFIPLTYAPIVFGIACAVVLFAAMAIVWRLVRDADKPWSSYAWLVAAALALVPVAGTETIANLACLQWQLLAAGVVAIALGRPSRATVWLLAGLLLVTALSSPLAIALVPTALWRSLASRSIGWSAFAPSAILVLALIPQLALVVSDPVAAEAVDTEMLPLTSTASIASFLEMTGPLALFGGVITRPIVGLGYLAIAAAFALTWVLVLVAYRVILRLGRPRNAWVTLLALIGPGVLIVAASLVIRPSVRTLALGNPGGTRYVLPLAYAMWVIVVVAIALVWAHSPQRIFPGAAAGAALLVIAVNFPDSLGRTTGPQWSVAYANACAWAEPGEVVEVPTSPAPWVTAVPCG